MTTSTVIKCLDQLFALCGTAGFVHSDNGPPFVSKEFKMYLFERGIASSTSSVYHPPLEVVRRRKLLERFGRPFNWP